MVKFVAWMRRRESKQILILLLIVSFAFLDLGCSSLKKKFIRKKKKDTEAAFIPVLDPIDYPSAHVSPEERYRYHYSLWWVWNKDLAQKIDSKDSDKNQTYLLNQIIAQVVEMKKWVKDEKQGGLDQYVGELNAVMAMYEAPAQMRSAASIKSKLERAAKKIRNEFNPDLMKDYFLD